MNKHDRAVRLLCTLLSLSVCWRILDCMHDAIARYNSRKNGPNVARADGCKRTYCTHDYGTFCSTVRSLISHLTSPGGQQGILPYLPSLPLWSARRVMTCRRFERHQPCTSSLTQLQPTSIGCQTLSVVRDLVRLRVMPGLACSVSPARETATARLSVRTPRLRYVWCGKHRCVDCPGLRGVWRCGLDDLDCRSSEQFHQATRRPVLVLRLQSL